MFFEHKNSPKGQKGSEMKIFIFMLILVICSFWLGRMTRRRAVYNADTRKLKTELHIDGVKVEDWKEILRVDGRRTFTHYASNVTVDLLFMGIEKDHADGSK